MRKIAFFLAVVLVLTASASAEVKITCAGPSAGVVTVSYDASSEPNLVRAFALTFTLDAGTFTSVTNMDPCYRIYPGQIVISDGKVTDYNTPYAPGSLGQSTLTIETGSLYTMDSNHAADPNLGYLKKPGQSGLLCKLNYSGSPTTLTTTEDAAAGGVVMENGANPDVNAPVLSFGPVMCLSDAPNYALQRVEMQAYHDAGYYLMGSAELDSWCTNPYQCDGDASGTIEGYQKYRVFSQDLAILVTNWKAKLAPYSSLGVDYPAADPRADFNHKNEGYQKYRVYTVDLTRMSDHWKWKDTAYSSGGIDYPAMPGDCPRVDGQN